MVKARPFVSHKRAGPGKIAQGSVGISAVVIAKALKGSRLAIESRSQGTPVAAGVSVWALRWGRSGLRCSGAGV